MFRAGTLGEYAAATARPAGIIFFYRDGFKKKSTLVQVYFLLRDGFKQQFILVSVKICCDSDCSTARGEVLGGPQSIHINSKQQVISNK